MDPELFLKMFANCIVVKGSNRSLILDLLRDSFTAIPDTMEEVIRQFQYKKSLGEVYDLYGMDNRTIVDEYVNFLIENDFGFLTNSEEFDLFIDMDVKFYNPSHISNCIVEISNITIDYLPKIVKGLENLYCKHVQFISYDHMETVQLASILQKTKKAGFESIELVLKYSEELVNFIPILDKSYAGIVDLKLHSVKNKDINAKKYSFPVSFIEKEIDGFFHCGIVDMRYFDVNRDKILESLNHNSCLNKKIAIDKEGNIKNCPSMKDCFGNIQEITLEEALCHPDFKKHWNVTKDQISVCKDCEFRHVCTDCRAFLEDPENQYSKPLKCGYDPYTNIWEDWSVNPLKQKAIGFYGLKELKSVSPFPNSNS